ncbi:MAG: hypothetical protein GY781_22035 [Gammaproteobacteria bacterium]|nr:hypothetical protein [Gammaproteobacteria bacterium]
MPETISFLLPSLYEARFQSATQEIAKGRTNKSGLSRAKKKSFSALQQWLIKQYNLPENYQNSAYFMTIGHGLTEPSKTTRNYWLRADPIMLMVGHNGLFCRGNRVLNVTRDERQSLQILVNEYFAGEELELLLFDSRQGYLKTHTKPASLFTPLAEVIGSEISNALPIGDDAVFWHGVLTDLQMLLHNCEVNIKRQERGEPAINGLWLWAESELVTVGKKNTDASKYTLYTDDPALSGALGKKINLQEIGTHYDALQTNDKHIQIYTTELLDTSSQDDQQSWLEHYQYWFDNWILPAVKAVNKGECRQLELITDDGFCYQYNALSHWCFWR